MSYKKKVYDANGKKLSGNWSDEEFTLLSGQSIDTDYVHVQHQKEVDGGEGIEEVIGNILKIEINDEDVPFISTDKEEKEFDYIKDNKIFDGYDASINPNKAASIILNFTINPADITDRKYLIDGDDFEGRQVLGVFECNQEIESLEVVGNGIQILFKNAVTTDVSVTISLGGYLVKYKPNSRTLISEIMVARMIDYKVKSTGKKFAILAQDENKNLGVVKSLVQVKHKSTNDTLVNSLVFVGNNMVIPQSVNFSSNGKNDATIQVTFNNDIPSGSTIYIPVLMTYQPTEYDDISVIYEYTPYQGLLNDIAGTSSSFSKKLHRLSDWRMFTTNLGSSSFTQENFNEILRPDNTILNAIDRLPYGLDKSHNYAVSSYGIEFVNDPPLVYDNNKYFRFHESIIGSYLSGDYENILSEKDKEILIYRSGGKLKITIDDVMGEQLRYGIKKYDGFSCLVIDELGYTYVLIVGVAPDQANITTIIRDEYDYFTFDLFKVDNAPLQIPRKI